jgi:nucleotide-binding universal stress UspA family protein
LGVTAASGTVAEGRSHARIVEVAADRDRDLVVMGTHGRTEHQPHVLNSVTARVLGTSSQSTAPCLYI